MPNACDIFDLYRAAEVLHEDDCADFLVIIQDSLAVDDGAMAVSGLTLSLLEGQWNSQRFMLLLKAFGLATEQMVRERVLVGLLLVMMKHNSVIREEKDLWESIQEVLTDEPELSFTALCNIARTAQVRKLESFNNQMTKEIMPLINQVGSDEFYDVIRKYQGDMERIARLHLDQNFLIFKGAYQSPFFLQRAAHWLKPWNEEQLLNVDEDERQHLQEMIEAWPMCDSDKYALINMSKMLRGAMQGQLPTDMLSQMGDNLGHTDIIANGYVQQLYRYFRLSAFTQSTPFELVSFMRNTLVYRWIVVGERARQTINELLTV